MIALSLTDVKECMAKLLLSETFDPFLFIEGELMTFGTFTMDGYLKKDFYEEGTAPEREYALWRDMREYCFSLIRENELLSVSSSYSDYLIPISKK